MKDFDNHSSGKFVLRIHPTIHRALKLRARARGVSLNEFCANFLSRSLEEGSDKGGVYQPILESLTTRFGDQFIGLCLFGSVAKGKQTSSSDIDLLVVLSQKVPLTRLLYRDFENLNLVLNDGMPRQVSLHFVHIPEDLKHAGGIWLECSITGVIISDPLESLKEAFLFMRNLIASGAVTRKETHGQGYWVRP